MGVLRKVGSVYQGRAYGQSLAFEAREIEALLGFLPSEVALSLPWSDDGEMAHLSIPWREGEAPNPANDRRAYLSPEALDALGIKHARGLVPEQLA